MRRSARIHLESEVPVCGMYRDDQLRMPERPVPKVVGRRSHPAALSLVSLLLLEPAVSSGQEVSTEQVAPHADRVTRPDEAAPAPASREGALLIKGTVTDNGEPVPFVTVFVKGTDNGTTTDIAGRFVLDLTELATTRKKAVLVMQYIGYTDLEAEVDLDHPADVVFRVEEGALDLTSFSVTYRKPPLHKRIWWGLQRPFRRR